MAGSVVSVIRYTESVARNGVILVISRVDHAAQKAVTRSTFAFSAAVNSAAAIGTMAPNAANPATPAAPTTDRRSSLLSERAGIEGDDIPGCGIRDSRFGIRDSRFEVRR